MSILRTKIASLSDHDLAKAFEEIEMWRNSPYQLPDGIVRGIHAELSSIIADIELRSVEEAILYEASKRFSKFVQKEKKEIETDWIKKLQDKYLVTDDFGGIQCFDQYTIKKYKAYAVEDLLIKLFANQTCETAHMGIHSCLVSVLSGENIQYESKLDKGLMLLNLLPQ